MSRGLELRIPPPFIALLVAAALWLLARGAPVAAPRSTLTLVLSLVTGLTGGLLAAWGAATFARSGTTVSPTSPDRTTRVVRSGPFAFTRNPMYVGVLLVVAAWGIWLRSPWLLLALPAMAAYLTRFQIVPEERILREKFGAEYDAYCARVRRWL